MLTKRDRKSHYKSLEDLRRRRIENLKSRKPADMTWTTFAQMCGRSQPFMSAIMGVNPTREIGEVLARDLEQTLRLPPGWLDQEH